VRGLLFKRKEAVEKGKTPSRASRKAQTESLYPGYKEGEDGPKRSKKRRAAKAKKKA